MLIKELATKEAKKTPQIQTSQSLFFFFRNKTLYRELNNLKAPGVDHIPSELIQASGGKLHEETHKLLALIRYLLISRQELYL